MTPLETHAVIAAVACRLAPNLAGVLDDYLQFVGGRPYIDASRVTAFRTHFITTVASREDVGPQELWDFGEALNVLHAAGQNELLWSKIAAVLLPFSAVAAFAQERR